MKIAPENEALYLEVEIKWKEIHRKRIEAIEFWEMVDSVFPEE